MDDSEDEPPLEFPADELVACLSSHDPIFPGLEVLEGGIYQNPDRPSHVVIESENYHALMLLTYTHKHKVDMIFIDPPYNTGATDWKYNNKIVDENDTYRHSKWLAMMEHRLRLAKQLLKPDDSVLVITIDQNELHHLALLLEKLFPGCELQMITIVNNLSGKSVVAKRKLDRLSHIEEYALLVFLGKQQVNKIDDHLFGELNSKKRVNPFNRTGTGKWASDRPNLAYPIYYKEETGEIIDSGPSLQEQFPNFTSVEYDSYIPTVTNNSFSVIWPKISDDKMTRWYAGRDTLEELAKKGFVRFNGYTVEYINGYWQEVIQEYNLDVFDNGYFNFEKFEKIDLEKYEVDDLVIVPKTVWQRSHHSTSSGSSQLKKFLGEGGKFNFPKSIYSIYDMIRIFTYDKPEAVILDFFAGSGTTLHATCLINARTAGSRQCILVTNNENDKSDKKTNIDEIQVGIFASVTRPRIIAAITGRESMKGEPITGKYLRFVGNRYTSTGEIVADGFDENVAFMRLKYLHREKIREVVNMAELLNVSWLASGARGEPYQSGVNQPFHTDPATGIAFLFQDEEFPLFLDGLDQAAQIWIVSDSDDTYSDIKKWVTNEHQISPALVSHLFQDYIEHFTQIPITSKAQ